MQAEGVGGGKPSRRLATQVAFLEVLRGGGFLMVFLPSCLGWANPYPTDSLAEGASRPLGFRSHARGDFGLFVVFSGLFFRIWVFSGFSFRNLVFSGFDSL